MLEIKLRPPRIFPFLLDCPSPTLSLYLNGRMWGNIWKIASSHPIRLHDDFDDLPNDVFLCIYIYSIYSIGDKNNFYQKIEQAITDKAKINKYVKNKSVRHVICV